MRRSSAAERLSEPELIPVDVERAHEEYERCAETPESVYENLDHGHALYETISESRQTLLEKREAEGDEFARERRQVYSHLEQGKLVHTRAKLENEGRGVTRPAIVDHDGSQILAFHKPFTGSLELFLGSDDVVYRVVSSLDARGQLTRKLAPIENLRDVGIDSVDQIKENIQAAEGQREHYSQIYGIDAHRLTHRANPFRLRDIDSHAESRAAVSASILSELLKNKERIVPVTVARNDEHGPGTLQQGVEGEIFGIEQVKRIYQSGDPDQYAYPILDLACGQFLNYETDGTAYNVVGGKLIDNGYSFVLSMQDPNAEESLHHAERHYPAGPLNGIALDILHDFPHWELDEDERQPYLDLVRDVNTYRSILQKKLTLREQRALPDSVREGDAARLVNNVFRYIFERVDENGEVIPETRTVAFHEARNFIARAHYIGMNGRPPRFELPKRRMRNFRERFEKKRSTS